jgi:hypothetical protein
MNYFVKIHLGEDRCVHARIYVDLQQNTSVYDVIGNKTRADPIEYF